MATANESSVGGALRSYAAAFAPNQLPGGDVELLAKLLGQQEGSVNAVFFSLFNVMGVWPMVYASLLFPTGRSARTPTWCGVLGCL